MLDLSPEHVAAAVGLSPRTVRRLEDPREQRRPRMTTLRPLASFYGLEQTFIQELASWHALEGSALRSALRERTADLFDETEATELAGAPDELRLLALRAARRPAPRSGAQLGADASRTALVMSLERARRLLPMDEQDGLGRLLDCFGQLDRRRRQTLLGLVTDMRGARERELGL
jgi:hypothetical protein